MVGKSPTGPLSSAGALDHDAQVVLAALAHGAERRIWAPTNRLPAGKRTCDHRLASGEGLEIQRLHGCHAPLRVAERMGAPTLAGNGPGVERLRLIALGQDGLWAAASTASLTGSGARRVLAR